MRLVTLIAAAALAGLAATPAAAETAQARAACIVSVFRLCPTEAIHGDRDGAKACLLRNIARAAPGCQAAVRAELPGDIDHKPANA